MNALEIRNLTKEYGDFRLDHICLELPSGCIMGLIGENGAGKSTLIKLIMNAVGRKEGEIVLLGKDNRDNFKLLKGDIGIVLDEAGFPETITAGQLNRIMGAMYKNWDEKDYFRYIHQFALPEKKAFKDYSRGMKMKLAIAVAMSHHAKLLILDEATSGLDPVARDEVLDILLEFTREEDHSILISSHIISDLEKLCDYIAFLHKGRLLFCEEKDRLLEEYGMLHCSRETFALLDGMAVKGIRENRYGMEVLVRRNMVPASIQVERAAIEDVLLLMVKGAEKQ